jgi:hypothetical protein
MDVLYRMGSGALAGILAAQWLSVFQSYLVAMTAWTLLLALAYAGHDG